MKTKLLQSFAIATAAFVAIAAGSLHGQETGSSSAKSPDASTSQIAPSLSMQLRQILKDFEDDDVVDDLDRNKLLDEIAKINAKLAKRFPPSKSAAPPTSGSTLIPPTLDSAAPAPLGSSSGVENDKETESQQSPSDHVLPVPPALESSNPSEIVDDSPAPDTEAEQPPARKSNIVVERLALIEIELKVINRKLDWLHKRSKDSIAGNEDPMTAQVK